MDTTHGVKKISFAVEEDQKINLPSSSPIKTKVKDDLFKTKIQKQYKRKEKISFRNLTNQRTSQASPPSIEEIKRMLLDDMDSTCFTSTQVSCDLDDDSSIYEDTTSIPVVSNVSESCLIDETSSLSATSIGSDFEISTFAESTKIHDITNKDARYHTRNADDIAQTTKLEKKCFKTRLGMRSPLSYYDDKENSFMPKKKRKYYPKNDEDKENYTPKKKTKQKTHANRNDKDVQKRVEDINRQFREIDEYELTVE